MGTERRLVTKALIAIVSLVAAVVPGTDARNLTVSGPRTAATGASYDLTLSWNVPTMQVGETWFGLVELGSDRKSPGNAGSLFVRPERTS